MCPMRRRTHVLSILTVENVCLTFENVCLSGDAASRRPHSTQPEQSRSLLPIY
jgi:hypothetical protein